MTFWSNNPAAPSFFQTLFFTSKKPAYLRTDMPPLYPETYTFSDGSKAQIRRMFEAQGPLVSEFLAEHYCGEDWRLRNPEKWIGNYLRDKDVVALGLFTPVGALLATIFSVPLGTAVMSHGGVCTNLRVIEGLCVVPQIRSKGVAGFMIRHADSFTSYKFGVCAHLWSREVAAPSILDTALRSDIYGYTLTGVYKADPVETMEWSVFVKLWEGQCESWVTSPAIVVKTPGLRRNASWVYTGYGGLAVVSNTGRYGGNLAPIYEIVWSGKYRDGILTPADEDFDFKQLVNGIAATLPVGGILFGHTGPEGGGVRSSWVQWNVGNSGAHSTYIYNYMPPAFGTCRIHMVREEL